ncbi:MAG: hypothetical protein CPDRYMAC_7030 [uncultured Paraburkholderia sp.]|nr:MAG: hypothetical protein CPDRYDRY_7000 [uncultured Paraburkholderia sp.]CAH2945792.1 MAG: hypothetical protein CPDRYMAC_7030 [uncultured Paraburkholderia sp.]
MPIAEIAERSGYSSLQSFSRTFCDVRHSARAISQAGYTQPVSPGTFWRQANERA